MPNKPVTYPQQIADLKTQLEQKEDQIARLLDRDQLVSQLEAQVAELQGRLDAGIKADQHNVSRDKAQLTDANQRAESAEQGLRNSQALVNQLKTEIEVLNQQIELLGTERLKHVGKDEKLVLLQETIQQQNFEIIKANQRLRDFEAARDEQVSALQREHRNLLAVVEQRNKQLAELRQKLEGFNLLKHLEL